MGNYLKENFRVYLWFLGFALVTGCGYGTLWYGCLQYGEQDPVKSLRYE